MKIDQKNTTNKNTLSIRPPHPSNIPHTEPSPSGCTADKYPELAVHPRMNFRSEHSASYCVRTPLALHTSCRASVCYECFVFTVFIPPYSPVDPAATADYTAAEYDYVIDAQPLATELPGKQCPFTSPPISPICLYLSVALGIAADTLLTYWMA